MLSSTLIPRNSSTNWKVRAIPRAAIWCGASPWIMASPNLIRPAFGL